VGLWLALACGLASPRASAQVVPPPFDAPQTPSDAPQMPPDAPSKPPTDAEREPAPPPAQEASAPAALETSPPAPASTRVPVSPPAVVVSEPPEPSSPRREDPQADRVVLLPTATTHTKGSVFFTNYDVVLLQGGYAFSDNTQITLTTIPFMPEGILFLDVSLKTSLYRGGLVRAAASGSMTGLAQKEIGVGFIGRAGAVAQVCLAPSCVSSFSISSNLAFVGPVMAMFNGAGVIYRAGRYVSLLGELASLIPVGRWGGEANGALFGGGLRFHGEHWGFDLTLMRALGFSTVTLPVLTASYRS
jgi:hypothetical protein